MSGKYGCRRIGVRAVEEFCYCEKCFEKQVKIDRLEDENRSLKAKLRYRDKKLAGEFFGSSTPSSKKHVKTNASDESQAKQGGAKVGHKGNQGRRVFSEEDADAVIDLKVVDEECPKCGGELAHKETDFRPIIDAFLIEAKKHLYRCQVKRCQKCRTEVSNRPLVLPKSKYGNGLISNSIIMHYLEGIPLKKMEKIWGKDVVPGNLIKIFHKLAEVWKPAVEKLKKELREEPVIHADETGWRTNGHSGYSWLFCSDRLALFSFRQTRSSKVVAEFLGDETEPKRPGVLVVDRYAGYNRAPCNIQYCYEHLKRDLDDLIKNFPKNKEVHRFGKVLRPLICDAMKLRNKAISDKRFLKKATTLKENILANVRAPANHLGIQTYQNIFIDNEHRLFHWADSRAVPAENNKAERELRPTVIARKLSFGSQSAKGAETRSILMSVLHTAVRRLPSDKPITHWFNESLEKLIDNPGIDPYSLLPNSV